MSTQRSSFATLSPITRSLSVLLLITLLVPLLAGCARPATPPASVPSSIPPAGPAPAGSSDPSPTVPSGTPGAGSAPTTDWPVSSPAAEGLDPGKLADLLAAIAGRQVNLHSVLIVRHGAIVLEEYFAGHGPEVPHIQYSVTKSFIATLIGIAIDQGLIPGVDEPLSTFFPVDSFDNPDPRKAAMTLEQVLTMSTGLDWKEGDPAYRQLYTSGDWIQFMLDLPLVEDPGSRFNYCSGCSHLLSGILQKATGLPAHKFAAEHLFGPLGIRSARWETDSQGLSIGGWGLNLTSRDMARLGYLYLHEGAWGEQRVISPEWVQAATQKHIATDGELGYGYQWWAYPSHGAYTALGRGGQTIFVVPNLDLVVVFTADLSGHEPVFALIDEFILPAVQDSPAD